MFEDRELYVKNGLQYLFLSINIVPAVDIDSKRLYDTVKTWPKKDYQLWEKAQRLRDFFLKQKS